MKRVRSCVFFACLFVAFSVNAQKGNTYKTGVGIKVYPTGVTLRHFVKPESQAVEFVGYFWRKGTRITGLYEFFFDLGKSENFKWYIGPGAHVGLYSDKYYGGGTAIGIDGVLGLDYKIKNAPLDISLDWQPSIEFGDFEGFASSWGGVGVRFTF